MKLGEKNIIRVSTIHQNVKVSRDKRQNPNMFSFYIHTIGGVYVVIFSARKSVRFKGKCWSMNSLTFIFNTAGTNEKKNILYDGHHILDTVLLISCGSLQSNYF